VRRRLKAGAAALGAALPVLAVPLLAAAQPVVVDRCVPQTPKLAELSGLATNGRHWYAVSDGGTRLRVVVLDPADCAVLDEIVADADPYDVEDLALGADGAFWLADIGDNDRDRSTVALHRLDPDGGTGLFRLSYPDGPHDAEALLLDRAGVPYLVTKELVGPARVYRPIGALAEPGPTPLAQVATVRIEPTDTPGGPAGRAGSVLVTGGAVSADGTVLALRTYTDAYLFPVPDGDVPAALAAVPVRIPLPDEPQGEALALEPDGTLLSGSERSSGGSRLSGSGGLSGPADGVPIRAVPAATALVAPLMPAPRDTAAEPPASPLDASPLDASHGDVADRRLSWQPAVVVGGLVGLLVLLAVRRRR
jgi:hypothetical protein